MSGLLELIGFIALVYLCFKYAPELLKFTFKAAVVLALFILALGAFEFISHLWWNHGFYIISGT